MSVLLVLREADGNDSGHLPKGESEDAEEEVECLAVKQAMCLELKCELVEERLAGVVGPVWLVALAQMHQRTACASLERYPESPAQQVRVSCHEKFVRDEKSV
jgi:hypothetical protein